MALPPHPPPPSAMSPFNFRLKQNSCHRPKAKNRNPFQLPANSQARLIMEAVGEDFFQSDTGSGPPGPQHPLAPHSILQGPQQLTLSLQDPRPLPLAAPLGLFQSPRRGILSKISGTLRRPEVGGLPCDTGRRVLSEKGNVRSPSDLGRLKINERALN